MNQVNQSSVDYIDYMVNRFRRILEAALDPAAPVQIVFYYDPKKRHLHIRPTQYHSETLDSDPVFVIE